MSGIARLIGRRRADPVTLEEFGYLLGRMRGTGGTSIAGVEINERRVMGITAWYSGVRYLSESVAFLPVGTYRRLPSDQRERRADPLWLRKPDKGMTRGKLLELWMYSLLHRSICYGFKLRDPVGRVVGMRYLHPDRVTPGVMGDGTKTFEIKMGDGTKKNYTSHDVFSVIWHTEDGFTPISTLQYNRNSLGVVAAGDEFAGRSFSNDSHVSKYIKVDDGVRQKPEDLKKVFEQFHKGLSNANEIAVLKGGDLKPVGLSPQDTQLLESRVYGVQEVARILRVTPHKLYDLSRATFSNIEHQSIESTTDSVAPWPKRFEDAINDPEQDLVTNGRYVEFNLEGLLRGDIKSRYESYHVAVLDGWMALDEPRRLENLPPQDGMNVVYRPANVNTVDPETGAVLIPAGKPIPEPEA